MQPPDHDEPRSAGLRPPRFGLKTLLWLVTLVAVFLGLYVYLGSHITSGLILLALAIFAHVAGNALGTQLRASGTGLASDPRATARPARKTMASDFAPATRLRHRSSLGRPIVIITLVGTGLGGLLGGIVFVFLMEITTPLNLALGILAAAILGGFWTFISVSFIQVAAGAAWQAMGDSKHGHGE